MTNSDDIRQIAYQFRQMLLRDRSQAAKILQQYPEIIDTPVYGKSETALHFFAVENELEIVVWLLSHGANPNGICEMASPFHDAASLRLVDVCRALLEAGADPNKIDALGETALHKASQVGNIPLIELLLDAGADPKIREMCGLLPIQQALPRKQKQVHAAFTNRRKPE